MPATSWQPRPRLKPRLHQDACVVAGCGLQDFL